MSDLLPRDEPEEWEKTFFEALLHEHAVVGRAAEQAGVNLKAVERRRQESPRFAALLDRAERIVDDALEFESIRRALEPNERPVFQRGVLVGVVKEWDTKHLEWVLERRMPEKYHLPSRLELGTGEREVTFKLALGENDPTPELESGEED